MRYFGFILISLFFIPTLSLGMVEKVSVGELVDFVESESSDNFENFIREKLREELEQNGDFTIASGQYIWEDDLGDSETIRVSAICTKIHLNDRLVTVIVKRNSALQLGAPALSKPIDFTADIDVTVKMEVNLLIKQGLGAGGACAYPAGGAMVSKKLSVAADAKARLNISLDVNPTISTNIETDIIELGVSPSIRLSGTIINLGLPRLTVIQGGALGKLNDIVNDLLVGSLESFMDKAPLGPQPETFANLVLKNRMKEQEIKLTQSLARAMLEPNEYANWQYGDPIKRFYELPMLTGDLFNSIVSLVDMNNFQFPITPDFLTDPTVQNELYYAVVSGDYGALKKTLTSNLACSTTTGMMTALNESNRPAGVSEISPSEFCLSRVDDNAQKLGDASDLGESGSPWYLTPGTNFDVGAKSIKGNDQPYMKRLKYKTVASKVSGKIQTGIYCAPYGNSYSQSCAPTPVYKSVYYGDGSCELEMRVYTKNINATQGLKPIMAIHGGSYTFRSAAFFGLESQFSHFTDRGYVVFAPFYRLTGANDGNVECNRASGADIIADVKSALSWVEDNASKFGASGKVTMFGQSAGAHLAAYLTVHEKYRIDRAWLVYPPTDYKSYLEDYVEGSKDEGTKAVTGFLAHLGYSSLAASSLLHEEFVLQNSLPNIVANSDPQNFPPMFLMHGASDTLVPHSQSMNMCNALGGAGESSYETWGFNNNNYRGVNECGSPRNVMHLFEEAGHAMDLRCFNDQLGIDYLCMSGSQETSSAIEDSYNDAFDWLATEFAPVSPPAPVAAPTRPSLPSGSACTWQSVPYYSNSSGVRVYGVAQGTSCSDKNKIISPSGTSYN